MFLFLPVPSYKCHTVPFYSVQCLAKTLPSSDFFLGDTKLHYLHTNRHLC